MILLAGSAGANEVRIEHQGLTLDGELMRAEGKDVTQGVVLLTHGTLLHDRAELMSALQSGLRERGVSSIAITLSLGQNDRHGAFDCAAPHRHRHGDAVGEIAAWVAWLKREGAAKIVLAGHSRGGAQTALYLAGHADDPVIAGAILVAPALFERDKIDAEYARTYGAALPPLLEKARAMVAAGHGDETLGPVGFLYCRDADVTAASFVDYYDDAPQKDTVALLPSIRKPLLVVTATRDQLFPNLAERVTPLADGARVRHAAVPDADHFFQDLYADELADLAAAFVGQL
jgi:pimeloyl-ACP methyl ester carboxylesterase